MALIKSANSKTIAREAIVLDLGDLTRQAEAMRAAAQRQAEAIIRQAREERDRLIGEAAQIGRTEGLAEGLAKGHREGVEQGRAQGLAEQKAAVTALLAGWSAGLDQFLGSRERLLAEAQRDVVRLALIIAEKITKRVIAANPEVVTGQLAAVLELVLRPSRLSVRIHPDDRAIIERALPALMQQFAAVRHVDLVEDAALSRGSCVARLSDAEAGGGGGPGGEIDASIDVQIKRMAEALLPGEGES